MTPTGRGVPADELIDIGARIAAALAEVDRLAERRNELVIELAESGLNGAQLAQLAGLSRQRIHQLTQPHKATEEALT